MKWPFERGKSYNRRQDIHERFGGQQQGGIITPAQYPLTICITGRDGEQHGYSDSWNSDGSFSYFGEGQEGDMTLDKGNKAIANHSEEGEDILLFQKQRKGSVRYEGEFICAGYRTTLAPDTKGKMRNALVFDLVPLDSLKPLEENSEEEATAPTLTREQLRKLALAAVQTPTGPQTETVRNVYQRSSIIHRYVLARAEGRCELCNGDAPFARSNGTPYLEPHHIRRLSDGGPDDPRFMGALCPNCHRKIHFGEHGEKLNKDLLKRITEIEGR